jgi:polyphosphate kinase
MSRNFDQRVEIMFPVENSANLHYLRDAVLENYLKDNLRAYSMQPDGSYLRLKPVNGIVFDVQDWLMKLRPKITGENV